MLKVIHQKVQRDHKVHHLKDQKVLRVTHQSDHKVTKVLKVTVEVQVGQEIQLRVV